MLLEHKKRPSKSRQESRNQHPRIPHALYIDACTVCRCSILTRRTQPKTVRGMVENPVPRSNGNGRHNEKRIQKKRSRPETRNARRIDGTSIKKHQTEPCGTHNENIDGNARNNLVGLQGNGYESEQKSNQKAEKERSPHPLPQNR